MGFNSIDFAFFFPIVVAGYFLTPQRFRWVLILVASCWFYMSFIPIYILILAFVISIDYIAGLIIERSEGKKRLYFLLVSIIANASILFFFKYANFFSANLSTLAGFLDWNYSPETLRIVLPIGLSFHTFQSLSYTIEVYRGRQKAERHFGVFASYVMFFPQLVAGPIERPQNLLHQFHEEHRFELSRCGSGLGLMLFGFFKKLVIADNLAIFVDQAYAAPSSMVGAGAILAAIFFAFQIYCDFSGYSDIARGAARVMGFSLMENFRRPFFSSSVGELWTRWHISLSSWMRDYIFMPLAVHWREFGKTGIVFAIMAAFLFSGLWHGANWTFIAWGFILGVALILEFLIGHIDAPFARSKRSIVWKTFGVFTIYALSLVFFRASSINIALLMLSRIPHGWWTFFHSLSSPHNLVNALFPGRTVAEFAVVVFGIVVLLFVEYMQERNIIERLFVSQRWHLGPILRWSAVVVATVLIIWLSHSQSPQFIYFQF